MRTSTQVAVPVQLKSVSSLCPMYFPLSLTVHAWSHSSSMRCAFNSYTVVVSNLQMPKDLLKCSLTNSTISNPGPHSVSFLSEPSSDNSNQTQPPLTVYVFTRALGFSVCFSDLCNCQSLLLGTSQSVLLDGFCLCDCIIPISYAF